MALLFALDRRAAAADDCARPRRCTTSSCVDRYVASNAAYGAARLHQDACGEFVAWVRELEIDRFGLPVPDRHLLLACRGPSPRSGPRTASAPSPAASATATSPTPGCRSARRRSTRELAAAGWLSPWTTLDGGRGRVAVEALTDDLLASPTRAFHGLSGGGGILTGMKSRVLVVDDDPALAEMLTIVLRGEGFDTAVVGDGTRALPAVRDLRPDVVLLDLMLPGMNGIDVCRAIRTESGVPIVMLTAKTDTVDIVLGLESGRRRLRRQAVQAQGAGRPHPGAGAPHRDRAGRAAGDRRRHHRRAGAPGRPATASRSR